MFALHALKGQSSQKYDLYTMQWRSGIDKGVLCVFALHALKGQSAQFTELSDICKIIHKCKYLRNTKHT